MAKSKKSKAVKKSPAKKAKPAAKAAPKKVDAKPAKKSAKGKTPAPKSSKPSGGMAPKAAKSTVSKNSAGKENLSPVRSRVLIQREDGDTKTAGGLFIPDVAKDKPLSGRVVAIGTGSYNKKGNKRPLDVQVGDRVLFSRYTGSQVQLNGEDLLVVEESEILGIIQD